MQFRDLRRQYDYIKDDINKRIGAVIESASFIQGEEVRILEKNLEEYLDVKHCVTCGNGTDALQLSLMVWEIGPGDAVFVPDFTFFSSGEVVAAVGAVPVFTDVRKDTFNMDVDSLEYQVNRILVEGKLIPRAVIAVDLFGLPANYVELRKVCKKYNLLLLEDGAQGFGGRIEKKKACSFGDISTTSFFPAKPLGCYGDGGAIFTDNDEWAELLRSYCVHGKGDNKNDNVRIGMNSRLDSIQAAVLNVKLPVFVEKELDKTQRVAKQYSNALANIVKVPVIESGFFSSWAQYTIRLRSQKQRDEIKQALSEEGIPSMIYYPKPMHRQRAFYEYDYLDEDFNNTKELTETVLSLPFHPYMNEEEVARVIDLVARHAN